MTDRLRQRLKERRAHFERISQVVNLLAPEAMLARGYSMTTTDEGRIITSIKDAVPHTTILSVKDAGRSAEVRSFVTLAQGAGASTVDPHGLRVRSLAR